jgi:hypothetical protein
MLSRSAYQLAMPCCRRGQRSSTDANVIAALFVRRQRGAGRGMRILHSYKIYYPDVFGGIPEVIAALVVGM